jgi:hypothetical protein
VSAQPPSTAGDRSSGDLAAALGVGATTANKLIDAFHACAVGRPVLRDGRNRRMLSAEQFAAISEVHRRERKRPGLDRHVLAVVTERGWGGVSTEGTDVGGEPTLPKPADPLGANGQAESAPVVCAPAEEGPARQAAERAPVRVGLLARLAWAWRWVLVVLGALGAFGRGVGAAVLGGVRGFGRFARDIEAIDGFRLETSRRFLLLAPERKLWVVGRAVHCAQVNAMVCSITGVLAVAAAVCAPWLVKILSLPVWAAGLTVLLVCALHCGFTALLVAESVRRSTRP